MATNYERGAKRERDLLVKLRAEGWYAERTAGSHGEADLIALKAGTVPLLIQVKSGKSKYGSFNSQARQALKLAARKAGAFAVLVWWPYDRKGLRWIEETDWPQ
jgi:Holliday junction resolvase